MFYMLDQEFSGLSRGWSRSGKERPERKMFGREAPSGAQINEQSIWKMKKDTEKSKDDQS